MNKNNIIEVRRVSKKYKINNVFSYGSLRDEISGLINPFKKKESIQSDFLWAIRDVSFEIKEGDSVGLIGSNGAGKSTLLKIFSRITYPTKGLITMRGKVSSLLEAGTGFHPELTGKENIFLNGTLLGMKKAEIQKQFESIVLFAGVENFLDTPVKHYSSGMYTRLAFSVAAHLDQDILIIDEVLSLGDISFQAKAMDKINEMRKTGKTVIFVSHNMNAVARVCNKTILLEKGRMIDFGDTEDIIKKYTSTQGIKNETKISLSTNSYENKTGIDKFKFKNLEVRPVDSRRYNIHFKDPFIIHISGRAYHDLKNFYVGFGVRTLTAGVVFDSYSLDKNIPNTFRKGDIEFKINIDPNILLPGSYLIDLAAHGSGISLYIPNALQFQLHESSEEKDLRINASGVISYPLTWSY